MDQVLANALRVKDWGACRQESRLESGGVLQLAGIQGHIWTETVRDRETLGYQIFPRLLALAERAWHQWTWEVNAGKNTAAIELGLPLVGPRNL